MGNIQAISDSDLTLMGEMRGEEKGIQNGIQKGIEKGIEKGEIKTAVSLYRNGKVKLKDVLEILNVSEAKFKEYMANPEFM